MGLNRNAAAPRLTEIPADLVASLSPADSEGKRSLFEWSADKYNTLRVRVYVPEHLIAAIDGFSIDFNDKATAAAVDVDDNTNRRQIVGRSVFGENGKVLPFDADDYTATMMVVVNAPQHADIDTLTLTLAS